MKYVTEKVPLSTNHFERFFDKKNITDKAIKSLYEARFTKVFEASADSDYDLLNKHFLRFHFFNSGNCGMLCWIALHAIRHMSFEKNVEIFSLKPGDHGFLVIGRDLTSNPTDYKSWGENSVICDPWSGGYYPATLLEKYLMDYKERFQFNSKDSPSCIVTNFTPEKQRLKLELKNHQFVRNNPLLFS